MNIKQLKAFIADLPDETVVAVATGHASVSLMHFPVAGNEYMSAAISLTTKVANPLEDTPSLLVIEL